MSARPRNPRFSGGFTTWSLSISTNREKRNESRLLVFSQGSRAKTVKYLWYKFLWEELTSQEMELFMLLPETLNSDFKIDTIRAILERGKKEIREKLERCPFLDKELAPSKEHYQGIRSFNIEIHKISRSLPKTKKFSGWIRSASAAGSKNSQGGSRFELEPLDKHENDYEDKVFNWYTYLTVVDSVLLTQQPNTSQPEES